MACSAAAFLCHRLALLPFVLPFGTRSAHTCVKVSSDKQSTPVDVTSFVTDVEGNLDYFDRFVEISEVLSWSHGGNGRQLELKDGTAVVFGGDAVDKGIGDIRFTKAFLQLAERYPGRVDFLLGNRDLNKLRIPSELHQDCLLDDAVSNDESFPYWLTPSEVVTPAQFLEQSSMLNSQANRLRWMLKETMGADGAFDRRAAELAMLREVDQSEVSDSDVVKSYIEQVTPRHANSFMLDFLKRGKLLHRFGPHLFVHGAVTEDNAGIIPGRKARETSLDAWVENLNGWARDQVEDYASSETFWQGKNSKERAAHALMDYGVPGGNGGATVVYGRWDDDRPVSVGVERLLREAGVTSVLCGHTPVGNCPSIRRDAGITLVSADTSYSSVGHRSPWGLDNRGQAVSEVLAYSDGRVRVHGRLEDGTEIEYDIGHRGADSDVMGRGLSDGWRVRARLKESDAFLLSRGTRPVEYRRVARSELG